MRRLELLRLGWGLKFHLDVRVDVPGHLRLQLLPKAEVVPHLGAGGRAAGLLTRVQAVVLFEWLIIYS